MVLLGEVGIDACEEVRQCGSVHGWRDFHMSRKDEHAGRNCPEMRIKEPRNLRKCALQIALNEFDIQARGCELQEDQGGFLEDPPGPVEDECGDPEANERVKRVPTRKIDDDCSTHNTDRRDRIADQMVENASRVEVGRAAAEYVDAQHIDREADNRDHEHLKPEDVSGMEQTQNGLVDDHADDQQEE